MESIISTFQIDWKIIIAQAINFGIVFFILYRYALKPLSRLMAERSDKIAKGIDDAKTNASMLERTETEYKAALAAAKAEANKIFQEGKKEAEVKRMEMIEDTKKEVAGMIENGKKVLDAEKLKMVEEAKSEIASIALKAVEKLLGSRMDDAFEKKAIEDLKRL